MKRLLVLALLAGSTPLFAEPKPDGNAVTLPTFIFDQRHAITAGVGFVVEEGGKRYMATAYHILGPAGGLKTRIAPRDVPREVKAIAGLCLGDSETVLLARPVLSISDARPFDEKGGDADVTFASLPAAGGPAPLRFSAAVPKKGDRVWLFARLVDRDRPTAYPALVTDSSASVLQYTMEDDGLNLRALSGAPVLAADGTVVGMHLGYGTKDGKLVGLAGPSAGIRARLVAAAKETK